ncbi:MAG: hypothetical protein DHS20C15_20390 [Planctomycetota bacterium]|nr:MAG: hypothetical protein DHS20C15_20390 [Planctomycetota bacterium]
MACPPSTRFSNWTLTPADTHFSAPIAFLLDERAISSTGMRVLEHDGSTHHGVGVLPTHPVERTRKGLAAGRDEQVEAAKALVLKRR